MRDGNPQPMHFAGDQVILVGAESLAPWNRGVAELWCWNIMRHDPHEWSGTLDDKPQTFTCPGMSGVMVSRGDLNLSCSTPGESDDE